MIDFRPKVRESQDTVPNMYSTEALANVIGASEKEQLAYRQLLDTLSALISGRPKVGKTVLLGTSILPLLIYSFDPKSVVVLWRTYPELMKQQWIVVFPFWKDGGHKNPIAYKQWEEVLDNHEVQGFLHRFGTVAIDSYTGWLRSAANYWLWHKNRKRAADPRGKVLDNLAQGDYNGLYDLSHAMIHRLSGGSWHFLATAHLDIVRDEETGTDLRVELQVFKSLKTEIPRLFSENYILIKDYFDQSSTLDYKLLTDRRGIYDIAGSQLRADGKDIKLVELPNLRRLFSKAKMSYEDKPHWRTGKPLDPTLLPEYLKKYV